MAEIPQLARSSKRFSTSMGPKWGQTEPAGIFAAVLEVIA
jgi:hypothetical protein